MSAARTALPAGRAIRSLGWPVLFLLPWLVGFVVFTAGPMLASLVLSLTDYDIIHAPEFVGLRAHLGDSLHGVLRGLHVVAKTIGVGMADPRASGCLGSPGG